MGKETGQNEIGGMHKEDVVYMCAYIGSHENNIMPFCHNMDGP